jgi:hypothetical protein
MHMRQCNCYHILPYFCWVGIWLSSTKNGQDSMSLEKARKNYLLISIWYSILLVMHDIPLCLYHFLLCHNIFYMSLTIWKLQDGTLTTIKGNCPIFRNLNGLLLYSYFSIMEGFPLESRPGGKPIVTRYANCFCQAHFILDLKSESDDHYMQLYI